MNLTNKEKAKLAIEEREKLKKEEEKINEQKHLLAIKANESYDLALNAQRLNGYNISKITSRQKNELIDLIIERRYETFIKKMKQYLV